MPLFLRLPAESKGSIRQGQQITSIAAVDDNAALHPADLSFHLHAQARDQRARALNVQQLTTRPPKQSGLLMQPVLKNGFRCSGSIAETAHPVLIQSFCFALFQFTQKSPPKPRLPWTEFIAIWTAHTGSTDHPTQPWTWGEQQGGSTATGRLNRCCRSASAPSPDQYVHRINVDGHDPFRSWMRTAPAVCK